MKHRWIGGAVSIGLAALTLGCAQLQAQPPTVPEPTSDHSLGTPRLAQAPTVNQDVTRARLDFGFALFEQLRQETPAEPVENVRGKVETALTNTPMKHRWIGGVVSIGLVALILAYAQLRAQPLTAAEPTSDHSLGTPRLSEAPTVNQNVNQAHLDFGFALFEQLRQASPDENVLVSPTSVAMALAMAYNGASGETQAAIASTLKVQELDIDQLNAGNQALLEYLTQLDSEVTLEIANSLWVNESLPVRPDYVERMQTAYAAEVATLDFSQPAATDRINRWVKERTRDRIPTIVNQLSADQLLVLVNAVYFKGAWREAFDRAHTAERPFTLASGETIQHPLMAQEDDYLYLETDQFQAVSLLYGSGAFSFEVILPTPGVFRFEVILPTLGTDLATLATQLTPENWKSWMGQMRSRPGKIQLPKFQFEYEADLIPALQALGMGIAFEAGQADFSGLTELNAFINQVRHKTFIEVNEAGTEAAASTATAFDITLVSLDSPFDMVVDRPFLASIRECNTGTLLFLGAIVDPR